MVVITPAERAVLRQMAAGRGTPEIARDLGVSEPAVEAELRSLFERLGARSRAEAVGAARQRGLLVVVDAAVSGERDVLRV